MEPIRVLIADDQPLGAENLKAALADEPDMKVTVCCDDGDKAKRAAKKADVALLKIHLPVVSGIEVTKHFVMVGGPKVVITAVNDDAWVAQAREAGAVGFVPSDADPAAIAAALRAAVGR